MKFFIAFLFPAVILNCSQKLAPTNNTQEVFTSTTIAKGELHGDGQEGIAKSTLVIKDSESWNALISKMNAVNPVTESFTETSIDFSKYQLIAVFEAIKTTGGYTIEVSCNASPDTITVSCKTNEPQGFATMIMTQPYHIVKIPKTDKTIVFEE